MVHGGVPSREVRLGHRTQNSPRVCAPSVRPSGSHRLTLTGYSPSAGEEGGYEQLLRPSLCQQVEGEGNWGHGNTRSRVKKRGPRAPSVQEGGRGVGNTRMRSHCLCCYQLSPATPPARSTGSAPPQCLWSYGPSLQPKAVPRTPLLWGFASALFPRRRKRAVSWPEGSAGASGWSRCSLPCCQGFPRVGSRSPPQLLGREKDQEFSQLC